ncbi:hypothetical protein [Rhodophyticola sp.]|jgi:hypothetical protein|uniref:hypothetical protein n=1 Tax=Rhodophyticola sp. TaxID=2680032 RepID=UPI003D29DA19
MADYQLLVFSWNDLFPGLTQSGTASSLVGQTFTFNGGGDIVTYRDTDQFQAVSETTVSLRTRLSAISTA